MTVIKTILIGLLNILPDNPFESTITNLKTGSTWWAYINYFVPVSAILAIASAWAGTMAAYYAWHYLSSFIRKVLGK